jgi:perosamine synthetase
MNCGPKGREMPARELIPVYRADLSGNERKYVNECLESGWISALGRFTGSFEAAVAAYTGAGHAIAVSNGTVALHLAIHCLGIGPGDEVIVPSFTFIASVNAIAQTGATPVFAECRAEDWLIDVDDVERKIGPRTKAIMPVHLYGVPCDMAALCDLAATRRIAIVEDCAEAFGTLLNGRHVGTFAEAGAFSFYGNKTITTGEGGMVITNDAARAELMRKVKGQGQSSSKRYWHEVLGFNYRMNNICAAIGLAQIERIGEILERKRAIAAHYRQLLARLPVTLQRPIAGASSSEWMMRCLLPPNINRDAVMDVMLSDGVETRPVFRCAHHMPMYKSGLRLPVTEDISARGLCLPSYATLTNREIKIVVDTLRSAIEATS